VEKVIYIIGPRRIQNELIADFLKHNLEVKCIVGEDFSCISPPGSPNKKDRDTLILLECQEQNPRMQLFELRSQSNFNMSQNQIALLNVPPGNGIEKECLRQGVRGFFYEKDSLELFLKGVRYIIDGELWVSRAIMSNYILAGTGEDITIKDDRLLLTQRETEILALVAVGARNEEVADELCISPHTVKSHLHNIFKKIDVPNRLQAALWAAKNL
jgi:LuxR family transcriptional regulator of csgAB operon